jgi:LAGLIDADG-like domain
LAAGDLNASQITYIAGIPHSTVREWLRNPPRPRETSFDPELLPRAEYSYLLGFYLGDGTISKAPRGVFRLRIVTDSRYPGIIAECAAAMSAVMPTNRVLVQQLPYRAVEVGCYSKAWPLVFPQHGPGRKHERKIELAPWQEEIVDRFPRKFLRGLIHADGCRVLNRVNGKDYPRYFFDQVSNDIRRLFCEACDRLGIEYTWSRWKTVSIARSRSVALLDEFVGPKT